jgi:diaminopimelate decarboxylase
MELDHTARRERLRGHELLSAYGTPVYVFFEGELRRNYRSLRAALDEQYPDSRVHFAVKANFNLGVLAVLREAGCGAEAYASCELTAATEAGFDPEDLLVTGMYRPEPDLERALAAGVDEFLVDNRAELDRITSAAATTGERPRVLVRGNPAMEVPTHPDVATATRETKFGLDRESGRAMAVARRAAAADRVTLAGVQLHLGSQIRGVEPYAVAAREMLAFAAEIRDETGTEVDVIDLGGGFPVPYDADVPATTDIIATVADAVAGGCDTHGLGRPTLYLEPGRRIVATAGTLLGSVGVLKETPASTFAVLDVGTNAVSSHWPYPIYALAGREPSETYDVAGPLCYTGDIVQEDVDLPPLEQGDVLAIDRIGAYSLSSSTHTNAEPKPPVVLVREDGSLDEVRARETCADVLGRDEVPDDLA